jgi:hypothetical protein
MGAPFDHEWEARKVREWLLLLLRFAITQEPSDCAAAHAMADEIDALGMRWRPAAPRFFGRTTGEVCDAIKGRDNRILRRHLSRIDDRRLRQAFEAAIGLPPPQESKQNSPKNRKGKNTDLWRHLRRKDRGIATL